MSIQRRPPRTASSTKKYQILTFAEELKLQIKKIKSVHCNLVEWDHIYKHFKQLYLMIQQLVHLKLCHSHQNQEKLPQFYQALHETTLDMRMKLMAELGKQENRRKKMQLQYLDQINQFKKQLEDKDKRIAQLQKEIKNIEEKLNREIPVKNQKLSEQLEKVKKQRLRAEEQNKKLEEKLRKREQLENKLRNEIKKLKQLQQLENPIHNQNTEKKIIDPSKKSTNIKQSTSPGHYNQYTQVKTSYENVLGSFSQIPNQRNLTQLDKTESHQTDRRAKSVHLAHQNMFKMSAEQFWRFLLIQASTIEQVIENNQ